MYSDRQKRAPVNVKIIPHEEQRYPTVGDYWWDKATGTWEMRISQMPDWRWERLIEIHERVELALCLQDEVSMEAIDAFDLQFEKDVAEGRREKLAEPGDDPAAPYYREHQVATMFEFMFALILGVIWSEYDGYVRNL